jgi:class I fructose-bisphosphate aldolase
LDGREIRLSRLFSRGNAVVVAADHGEHDGPLPGLIDLPAALKAVNDQADAVLLAPGMVRHCAYAYNYRGGPFLIVRLNWSSIFAFGWNYVEGRNSYVCEPEEAVALGADLVLVQLCLHTGSEANDARNVEIFSRLAARAHALGLPVVGELFPPRTKEYTAEQLHDEVYRGCRIIAELGADLIKTFYTHRFAEVVQSVPVPVLALGAEKTPTEVEALELARMAIAAGAKGVVFGRNVLQAQDPARFLAALAAVVKQGVPPAEAASACGLVGQGACAVVEARSG